MASDILSREQRLRKEAELQSLYSALASFRDREASYIEASATIPGLFLHQINDIRQKIKDVEHELADLEDETIKLPAPPFYQKAFEAELNEDYATAIKLYKSASRHGHQDAQAALRSLRYMAKTAKLNLGSGNLWSPAGGQASNRIWIGLAVLIVFGLIVAFTLRGRSQPDAQETVAEAPAASSTPTASPTQTLLPTPTATQTSSPGPTAIDIPPSPSLPPPPLPTEVPATGTPVAAADTVVPTVIVVADTLTPTPLVTVVVTLRPAPMVREPRDGLVWNDGSIVFEFENLNLAGDELYCLNTLRGYDLANNENWSFPPFGEKRPYAVIEPNVFRVARAQNVRCIVWSGYIGKGTCDTVISESTAQRVIGLPRPCDLNLIEAYSQSNQNP